VQDATQLIPWRVDRIRRCVLVAVRGLNLLQSTPHNVYGPMASIYYAGTPKDKGAAPDVEKPFRNTQRCGHEPKPKVNTDQAYSNPPIN
jgi:hypothetical protein